MVTNKCTTLLIHPWCTSAPLMHPWCFEEINGVYRCLRGCCSQVSKSGKEIRLCLYSGPWWEFPDCEPIPNYCKPQRTSPEEDRNRGRCLSLAGAACYHGAPVGSYHRHG
ncbi:hypothetical protein UPYG_G00166900 [Umbra pygmaea]|uniref:Uncharacterized protein n=1 Tax=Umbra pygmaea TaxID=75934 RepID=A0ABD0WSF6_UMBPY